MNKKDYIKKANLAAAEFICNETWHDPSVNTKKTIEKYDKKVKSLDFRKCGDEEDSSKYKNELEEGYKNNTPPESIGSSHASYMLGMGWEPAFCV